ncbi:hypothetical protein AN642_00645 [Epulopiscium sp. SCG-B10WGA-EpuloA2]|nr:hypothetical protein AN642_00645 [Epulopiscium sp. SCG-B10WGA-EpuloA2]
MTVIMTVLYQIVSVKAALDCATLMICHTVQNARKQTEIAQCKLGLSHDSVTVSQHAQNGYPETRAAKWNSASMKYFICAYAFMSKHLEKVY